MEDILRVQNKNILDALPNHTEGEIAYCEDELLYYRYEIDDNGEGSWQVLNINIDTSDNNLSINLYELNKNTVASLSDFDSQQLDELSVVIDSMDKVNKNQFYMLYGKEISYFTLFTNDGIPGSGTLGAHVVHLISNSFASIKDYDIIMNSTAVEIWVRCKESDEITVLYLFPYDEGIVSYE